MRDAFFASPEFPRLLTVDGVKETIARGVSQSIIAYVGKRPEGGYDPFVFGRELMPLEVEISDDIFILTAEEAKKHVEPQKLTAITITPQDGRVKPGGHIALQARGVDQHGRPMALPDLAWHAKGGIIDESGDFTAGQEEGEYLVEAKNRRSDGSDESLYYKRKRTASCSADPRRSRAYGGLARYPPRSG